MIATIYIVQVTTTDLPRTATSRADALHEIADGIAALASRRRCAVARRVHHSGISLGHLQILWILQEHGPLPVSRLADWLGIGAPNATGLLDRMEQRGLVERLRDSEDRRVVLARATALGLAAVAEHDGWRVELIEDLLDPLPTEQVLALATSVRRARRDAALTAADAPSSGPGPEPANHRTGDGTSTGGVAPTRGVPTR
jgi:DNA-binding MarR family transcriptional regulator